MFRISSFILLVSLFAGCKATSSSKSFQKSLFKAYDHTLENMFSENIEGPAVNKEGKLYVVNYLKNGTIGYVREDGTCELFTTLPEKSIGNSIQFNKTGNLLVADFTGHNILEVDAASKQVTVYAHNDAFNQPNDICINKSGQLFATDPDWKLQKGQLWRIDEGGKTVLLKTNMGTTNGICLSPDEKILYVNESVQRRVLAYDVDEKGDISNERVFTTFDDHGLDGMKCDKDGNLYITRYGKGAIAIFSPGGKQIQEVMLKGKKTSNLTFGGKDYKTCFVTLQDRKAIEKFRTDVAGR